MMLSVQPIRFINAEPGLLPFVEGPTPVVILSFGAEEGPIEDRAVGVIEARQMVMDILDSLATMGDPLAKAIGEQFFSDDQDQFEYDEYDGDSDECSSD